MSSIISDFLGELKPRFDDDIIDRINYCYTPWSLLIVALFMLGKQYFGQPIQCWVPAQFQGGWEQYTENYCFVQNTYFLPLKKQFPNDHQERDDLEIGYYQWVPFVLALQAFLFYLPAFLWHMMNWHSGIYVKSIVDMANDAKNYSGEDRKKNMGKIVEHISECLQLKRALRGDRRYFKHKYGVYVTLLYCFVKLMYLLNVVLQFFILNNFLGTHYRFWGFEILRDLWMGREWQESGHFPRVTMCDFEVRVLGNLHRWTVQCVLAVNMYNEKVYLIIWWWFLIVAVATFISLLYWIIVSVLEPRRKSFVTSYLRVCKALKDERQKGKTPEEEPVEKKDEKQLEAYDAADIAERKVTKGYMELAEDENRSVRDFIQNSLRPDGVFLLRMIATNAGDVITTDLVGELFEQNLKNMQVENPEKSGKNDFAELPRNLHKRSKGGGDKNETVPLKDSVGEE